MAVDVSALTTDLLTLDEQITEIQLAVRAMLEDLLACQQQLDLFDESQITSEEE